MTTYELGPDPREEIGALKAELNRLVAGAALAAADHDSQRRDLQRRNSELVERARHAERIVSLLYPATHIHGYFISSVAILAQPRETQEYFAEVLRLAEAQRQHT